MKTKSVFTFFKKMMPLLCLVFLTACQKKIEKIPPENKVNSEEITKINTWLNSQKTGINSVIPLIRNNLSFSDIRFEKLSNKENLIIIPINEGFKSAVNKDKNPLNHLLLIVNEAGKIRKGNIVQFVAPNGVTVKKLPDNTFYNFYNAEHLICDGRFTFLNFNDKILYQMDYKNGILSAYGEKTTKNQSKKAGDTPDNLDNCIDWYIVTTYYNSDGTTSSTWEYLYTSCNNSTDEELPPADEGNGPVLEIEQIMSPVQKDWLVKESQDNLPNIFWQLWATDQIFGTKKASQPGGGYFTGITHLGEQLYSQPEFTWHKSGATTAYTSSEASCTISGVIKRNNAGHSLIQSVKHTYTFSSVFP